MAELDTITAAVRDALAAGGVAAAVCEYPAGGKLRWGKPVVAVGIKGGSGVSAGFAEYMGEQYDADTDTYRELYGKRLDVTLGLDIYSPKDRTHGAAGCMTVFGQIAAAQGAMPPGLRVRELVCGETQFDAASGMFLCRAEMKCTAFMYAALTGGERLLSFTLRGSVAG